MLKTSKDFLVTESALDAKCNPNEILEFLRGRKTTGKLSFDLHNGGIRNISVVEKTAAGVAASKKIRDALDMEII